MAKWAENLVSFVDEEDEVIVFTTAVPIGWVPVDAEGLPFRTTRGQTSQKRKEPIKVYRIKWRAEAMSPVGKVKEVRMLND